MDVILVVAEKILVVVDDLVVAEKILIEVDDLVVQGEILVVEEIEHRIGKIYQNLLQLWGGGTHKTDVQNCMEEVSLLMLFIHQDMFLRVSEVYLHQIMSSERIRFPAISSCTSHTIVIHNCLSTVVTLLHVSLSELLPLDH